MEIVKFKDGTYGIRRRKWRFGNPFSFECLDIEAFHREAFHREAFHREIFWWDHECLSFKDCKSDLDSVFKAFNAINHPEKPLKPDYGTPIDTDEESFWNKIKNNKKKLTKLQDKVSTKLTELDEAIEERE